MRFVVVLLICCGCFIFGRKKAKTPKEKPATPKVGAGGGVRMGVALDVVGEGLEFAEKPFVEYLVDELGRRGIVVVEKAQIGDYSLGGKLKVRVVLRRERYLEDEWEFEISGEWRLYQEAPGRRTIKAIKRLLLRRRGRGRSATLKLLFGEAAKKIAAAIKVAP